MRIIIGRDYYDSALAYGRDEAICFVRSRDTRWTDAEAKERGFLPPGLGLRLHFFRLDEPETMSLRYRQSSLAIDGEEYDWHPLAAYVCGTRYQGLRIDRQACHPSQPRHWVFWDLASLTAWLAERGMGVRDKGASYWQGVGGTTTLAEHFKPAKVEPDLLDRMIRDHLTIVTYTPPKLSQRVQVHDAYWRVNGDNLGEMEFFRVLNAYMIFQEISMWVANLAMPDRHMVKIHDSVRIAKHGFDKHSFRKAKAKE